MGFVWVYLALLTVALLVLVLWRNEQCNITKSIAFIKRDNILYMVKMGYLVDYQCVGEARKTATLFVKGLDEYLASGYLPDHIVQITIMENPVIERTKRSILISYEYEGVLYTKKIRDVYDL